MHLNLYLQPIWSARYVHTFKRHFIEIIDALIGLEEEPEENAITRRVAEGI